MKKLLETRYFLYSVVLLLSSMVERTATFFIEKRYQLFATYPLLYHFLSLVLLCIMFVSTNIALKRFISSVFVSRRVFKKKYVGGHWLEIVFLINEKGDYCWSHYAAIEIGYDTNKIYLSGTDYNADYQFYYNLETANALMENNCLEYLFRCNDGNKNWMGFGTISFHKLPLSKPNRYTGKYENEDGDKYRVEGFLLNEEDVKKLDDDFETSFRDLTTEKKNLLQKERLKILIP